LRVYTPTHLTRYHAVSKWSSSTLQSRHLLFYPCRLMMTFLSTVFSGCHEVSCQCCSSGKDPASLFADHIFSLSLLWSSLLLHV
jgi:hypothetical protein